MPLSFRMSSLTPRQSQEEAMGEVWLGHYTKWERKWLRKGRCGAVCFVDRSSLKPAGVANKEQWAEAWTIPHQPRSQPRLPRGSRHGCGCHGTTTAGHPLLLPFTPVSYHLTNRHASSASSVSPPPSTEHVTWDPRYSSLLAPGWSPRSSAETAVLR